MRRRLLRSARLVAEVMPEAGGGLARLDWLGDGSTPPLSLLRGLADNAPPPPLQLPVPLPSQLACFPLLPWSNRMAPTGFEFEGRRHVPAPNRDGEPCPIHGDGWQQAWTVAAQSPDSVALTLARREAVPFAYEAALRYALQGDALAVELEVSNAGAVALPFGLGLHPWLPDPLGARLRAGARGAWLSGPDKLPARHVAVPHAWDFTDAAALPQGGVDNVFDGWDGVARVDWPGRGVGLSIEADMEYFILYVPPGRDFFCFEPVDHPINAHNLPGYPGLTVLAPGAVLRRRVLFRGHAL